MHTLLHWTQLRAEFTKKIIAQHHKQHILCSQCACVSMCSPQTAHYTGLVAIHTDPENAAPENTLFWKRVSGWKNTKSQPSPFHVDSKSAYLPKRWHHRPTPRPLDSDLWTPQRPITTTTTTTMADYMLVIVPQKILRLSCTLHAL